MTDGDGKDDRAPAPLSSRNMQRLSVAGKDMTGIGIPITSPHCSFPIILGMVRDGRRGGTRDRRGRIQHTCVDVGTNIYLPSVSLSVFGLFLLPYCPS